MADEEVAVEESASPAQSPLVAVTFQRNAKRKEKYLEAEPKALGITQICLSVYNIIGIGVFQAKHLGISELNIPLLISSLLILIAGNVAVAAKNLHLPKLRACLGMQIVSCAASVLNVILIFVQMGALSYRCWYSSYDHNSTLTHEEICRQIETIQNHFFGGGALIQATLLAISATLAAYCCKVVNCCAPAPKMPVITIHSPPVQQRED
ncbi:uncharacterized protein LOC110366732 [Fundulus heteroclitus]|uniref:uncharacterized protein LOC110366732 n=1 Tax=Fundulus heteroclitus TaxID=8078 RepID=UPI000B374F3A|nr:uncharacterized protein LOC110366732 [Fundulus heteroclitus]